MIKVNTTTDLSPEANKLKNELVQETIQSLLINKDSRFDLRTEEGINQAVDCMVKFHLQQKIANGEIQMITSSQTTSDRKQVEV